MTVAVPSKEIVEGGTRTDAKGLGAFYTNDDVARFLVHWAVRAGTERILDPSFGGGVFLEATARRLRELGRQCGGVYGVELDSKTHTTTSDCLSRRTSIDRRNLLEADFFAVDSRDLPSMDAVVGNPPYIRYQRFRGGARELALQRAAEQNVFLPRLASSWAPFVVHSTAFLRKGGRLAMVLPMELGHANYARPVLTFLAQNFSRLHLLTFQRCLFPNLNEDTVLLLADGKRIPDGRLAHSYLHDVASGRSLWGFAPDDEQGLDMGALLRGQTRLTELLIPHTARELYARLQALGLARRFGALCDVGIGYVSGNNAFFHPRPEDIKLWEIPARYLRRAVLTGAALRGIEFNDADWRAGLDSNKTGFLLHLRFDESLPPNVARYLENGQRSGVPNAYKCRVRPLWYRVPHVNHADGFLTYMSGVQARLVANTAGAVAPNALHIVRLHRSSDLTMSDLAMRWQSSLTQLSVEIEGHALGGGMLKLEPTEAENVLVAAGGQPMAPAKETVQEFDVLMRAGEIGRVRSLADQLFLRSELGLSAAECEILHDAALQLRNRRMNRKRQRP